MKGKRIVVFPNDPLKAYFDKGELPDRYFNPGNFFEEIHVISLVDKEIEEAKVKALAGEASFKIHPVGRPTLSGLITGKYRSKIRGLISKIKPQMLRAYNSSINGWLAAGIGQQLNIPVVISLHTNPEKDIRARINKVKEPKRWLIWNISKRLFEPYALSRAAQVICAYGFIYDYALKYAKNSSKIKVKYNQVDMDRFNDNVRPLAGDKRTIKVLCVGRLFKLKNPENIIKAIDDLSVELTIIGDGPYRDRMKKLVQSLGIDEKINFIRAVHYSEIDRFYKEADIFVSNNSAGGISKPVIEAMASGLPIVINKPYWESEPELIGGLALVVEDSPLGYREAFQRLINDANLRSSLGRAGRLKALEINGKKMEREEEAVYETLVNPK